MQFSKPAQEFGSQAPVDVLSSSDRDLDCAHWSQLTDDNTTADTWVQKLKIQFDRQTEQMES